MKLSALLGTAVFFLLNLSCSTSPLRYGKTEELKKNKEFEDSVLIVRPDAANETAEAESGLPGTKAVEPVVSAAPSPEPAAKGKDKKGKGTGRKITPPRKTAVKRNPIQPTAKSTKSKATKAAKGTPASAPAVVAEAPAVSRQPDIEDTVGFAPGSRRPLVDPFRVGEEVVHDVHYFKVSAGELRLKVEPFAMVNNRRSYTYAIEIKTSSLFNAFYSVDDRAETFVDYEDLTPRAFQLHVKESGQLREAKMLFDYNKNLAKFWEKKVTKEDGEEEKRQEWELLPYSQDIYSAAFYMRIFEWEVGKEYAFRVANDNENLVFSGKALRREVLDTKLGPMKAIVIQPHIVLSGKFKPIGDNYIWLSDDDRKYILRIESKIKIGTLVSEVVSIKPGKP